MKQKFQKSYNKKPVLQDVSIDLKQGEAVGLLGPNGAGKTTLFSIIIGITKTDNGRLGLGDHDITNLPIYLRARLGISYLPQESSIFRGLTVKNNIKAILEVKNFTKEEIEEKQEMVEVIAWYSPMIPVSQGPTEYWGLPGLILELSAGNTTMLCSKIVMNPEEKIEIKRPTKGEVVTKKEYNEIITGKMQEMRDNRGRGSGGRSRGL